MDQTLPLALAPAISNPYLKYPDSGHAEDRQPECCFVPGNEPATAGERCAQGARIRG